MSIEKAILTDRDFLAEFDPSRNLAAFERQWRERGSGARMEVHSFEPHYEGSPVVWGQKGGVSSAIGSHRFEARPGHHLAPQPLSSGQNLFEALGPGFTLLALDADRWADRFEAAASRLGLPLATVRDSRKGGRERYGAGLVLIRPDQFVAWADYVPDRDPEEILRRAAGHAPGPLGSP